MLVALHPPTNPTYNPRTVELLPLVSMASTPPDASTLTATLLRSQPKISKKLLNEDDYPAWAIEATRQLRRQKLLDVVDGTRVRPDSGPEQAK